MTLRHEDAVNARAEDGRLHITCCSEQASNDGDIMFQVGASSVGDTVIDGDTWRLPGLTVRVETNARAPEVGRNGNGLELRYTKLSRDGSGEPYFDLRFAPEDHGGMFQSHD